jgi:hypothetical protein
MMPAAPNSGLLLTLPPKEAGAGATFVKP